MKNISSIIVALALFQQADAAKLQINSQSKIRYEESEGPTKADYGESDNFVLNREEDLDIAKNKASGWTNPLSWTDDGTDDDLVVDVPYGGFVNEDAFASKYTGREYQYD